MTNKKWFFTKNDYLINHKTNICFEDVLVMSKEEFTCWCVELRKAIVYAWDELGVPPVTGKSEEDLIDGMNRIIGHRVNEFWIKDDEGNENVIRNTMTELSGILTGFFPSIMKVKINYTKDSDKGNSIYDFFAENTLLPRFITYASRHFKRDSFYAYSDPVKYFDQETAKNFPCQTTAIEWIQDFEDGFRTRGKHDYWLCPVNDDKKYTGYNEKLKERVNLSLNKSDILKLGATIPERCKTNVDWERSETYQIRTYEYGHKLFPSGFKAFRVSFSQVPAQFPPLTARAIYEKYTADLHNQSVVNILDPSIGWGGRLLGAMAIDDRYIHYIGTDPNTDHNTSPGRTKYHELADFFNQHSNKASAFFPCTNTYDIFQVGSEVLREEKGFQKYKHLVDLVFTSPPYFSREKYSESEGQSFKKFGDYESWRDSFLLPTIQMCYDWLKPERYFLWNIADLKVGDEFLPLEADSIKFAKQVGFEYVDTLKMTLAQMPGSGRVDENGKPKAKNSVMVNGKWLRYEPVFVFIKN